jgi:hypothetical protein
MCLEESANHAVPDGRCVRVAYLILSAVRMSCPDSASALFAERQSDQATS